MSYNPDNVLPALLLVLGAGASTGIGAAVVFIPSLVKLASRRVLAASLGFSAGVMTYVSFVEIFGKSLLSFVNAGYDDGKAYLYATLCFFAGVVTMLILNYTVDYLLGKNGHDHHDVPVAPKKTTRNDLDKEIGEGVGDGIPACCGSDPVKQLDNVQKMASVIEIEDSGKQEATVEDVAVVVENQPREEEGEVVAADDENQRLHKMGLNTAIAIGLHNFPEGLATFVAALQDPKVGAVLAIAIAIHNVPEGLCVALPIYYSSGNRMKGFLWALLSGASEFVAALLGWLILANVFSEIAYGLLFGLVGGMMIMISMKELLPTAHVYDPKDTCVSLSFIVGMLVMALSLVLFQA